MSVTSVNPATGHVIGRYELHTEREIDRRLERSAHAFGDWSTKDFAERATYLRSAAARLREQLSSLAKLIAVEMGKPLAEGKAEVEKCAWVCEHYADNAKSFLEPVTIGTDAQMSRVVYRPLGPVLALMPWNFPFCQLRFAAPTLMAGNVAVLGNASNVTGCALAIERPQSGGVELLASVVDGVARHVAKVDLARPQRQWSSVDTTRLEQLFHKLSHRRGLAGDDFADAYHGRLVRTVREDLCSAR